MDGELRAILDRVTASEGYSWPEAFADERWLRMGSYLAALVAEQCAETCLFVDGQAGGKYAAACVALAATWRGEAADGK